MLTAHGTVDNAVEALKTRRLRLHHQTLRPRTRCGIVVRKALRTRDLSSADATRESITAFAKDGARFGIIGESQPILDIYAILERVADTPTTVLITGESGTGKELVARALHENSSRKRRPVHQGQLRRDPQGPDGVELFGYERGAFTGRRRLEARPLRARFTAAPSSSTRSAKSPRDAGEALARVAGERVRARRRHQDHPVDVRLVAATNRDLRKREIVNGAFREDLFYRLNVVPSRCPRCASARSDIRCSSPLRSKVQHAAAQEPSRGQSPTRPRSSWPTAGRATSASSRTSSSARCSSRTARASP
jgi:two-component system response regulator AtoC